MKICITDARMRLGDLIRRAQAGEDVILTRGRVAVARLVPLDPPAKDEGIAGAENRVRLGHRT
jgi:prevent-host-death family protein